MSRLAILFGSQGEDVPLLYSIASQYRPEEKLSSLQDFLKLSKITTKLPSLTRFIGLPSAL